MNLWLVILIVICSIIYIIAIPALCYNVWEEWKKGRNLYLIRVIPMAVFAPLFVVYGILILSGENVLRICKDIKKQGGIRNYFVWRRWEKLRDVARDRIWKKKMEEEKRIGNAYKAGMIRRDEIPRSENGISSFELYGNLFGTDWRDLVYVENEYNETINNFFKRHQVIELKHRGMRIVYLPRHYKDIANFDYLRYWNPGLNEQDISSSDIKTTDLLADLCYPSDAFQLKHGLMSCFGYVCNHPVEYLHGDYYPLEEADEEGLLSQIAIIAKEVCRHNTGGLFCTVERPSKDKKPTKNFADEQFDWEIRDLVDEIRERVERLEQRGISKNLLMKMISKEREFSRIVITRDMRIILPEYHNMEIKMEPINKAVYLLFLKHPEGIVFKHLPDYRKELEEIYQKIKPNGLTERAKKSIEDVTNPCLNSINEKCARIRGAFVSQFDDSLAEHYYVFGMRGEAKRISLPRDLVVWE